MIQFAKPGKARVKNCDDAYTDMLGVIFYEQRSMATETELLAVPFSRVAPSWYCSSDSIDQSDDDWPLQKQTSAMR